MKNLSGNKSILYRVRSGRSATPDSLSESCLRSVSAGTRTLRIGTDNDIPAKERLDNMKYLIGMTSITYAVKAQKLLNSKGYRCDVISTPKTVGSGCGYSLSVRDDPRMITALLRENNIKYKEVY